MTLDPRRVGDDVGGPPPGSGSQGAGNGRGGRELRGTGGILGQPIADVPAPPDVRRREAFYRRALAAADALAAVTALLLGVAVIGEVSLHPAALLGVPLLILGSKVTGLYDRDELLIRKTTTIEEIPGLVNVGTLVALVAAIAWAGDLGAAALAALWAILLGCLVLFRSAARRFAMRHTPVERCLVVGDADAWAQLDRRTAESPHTSSRMLGYVPLRDRIREDDPEPIGRLAELGELALSIDVHRVIVAPRDAAGSEMSLDVVRRAKQLGLKVSVLPRILEVVGSSVAFDDVDGITLLGVRRFGLLRSSAVIKRSLDILLSAVALVVLAPALAAIAAAIRLDCPGPVFFRQQRIGRNGQPFDILKFRTMVADADARKLELQQRNESEGLFKIADDPRVTRVGRWLRRTSLDELPQLINVLRGDMSLVGPRPLVPEEDRRVEGWHRRRLHIQPGMTGPWQILGSTRIPLYEMVKIDYLYVANWSLWADIKIMLRTLLYVLARRNR